MSFALGSIRVGSDALAFGPLHDPPVLTYVSPTGVVSSGGPTVTVDWTYSQPQNDPQEEFRVTVWDVAATPDAIVYDTGWITSEATQLDVDFDELELPTDGPVRFEVQVRATEYEVDADSATVTMDFGAPQLTITQPLDQSVHTDPDSIDVGWTVTDTAGHAQAEYRVRLLTAETNLPLTSTGWVTSAVTAATLNYIFVDNTQVKVEVTAKNENGIRST